MIELFKCSNIYMLISLEMKNKYVVVWLEGSSICQKLFERWIVLIEMQA